MKIYIALFVEITHSAVTAYVLTWNTWNKYKKKNDKDGFICRVNFSNVRNNFEKGFYEHLFMTYFYYQ